MKKNTLRIALIIMVIISVFIINYFITLTKRKPVNTLKSEILVNESIQLASKFYNGNDIIKNITAVKNCDFTSSCLEIDNPSENWFGTANSTNPVALSSYNLLKLVLKSNSEAAGINLTAKFAAKEKAWWQGKQSINIGVAQNDVIINLDSGTQEEPLQLFKEKFIPDKNGFQTLFLIFDEYGRNIIFSDSQGSVIKKIDIVQASKNLILNGLFQDKLIHLGVFLAPRTQLTISEFYLIPFKVDNSVMQNFVKNPASNSLVEMLSY